MTSVRRPLRLSSLLAGSNGLKLRLPMEIVVAWAPEGCLSDPLPGSKASHRLLLEVHAGGFPGALSRQTSGCLGATPSCGERAHGIGAVLDQAEGVKLDCSRPSVGPLARTKSVKGGQHGANLGRPTEAFKARELFHARASSSESAQLTLGPVAACPMLTASARTDGDGHERPLTGHPICMMM